MYSPILYHFLSYLTLKNIVTLKLRLGCSRSSKWHHSIDQYEFLIVFDCNYMAISCIVCEISEIWVENRVF